MQSVRDGSGTRYLLVKESDDTSLVRDPATGEETHVRTAELERVDEPPLATVATSIDDHVRQLLTAVHDDRALGLLLEIDRRGPVDVRTLLSATTLCESDLHGLLAECRAADLVTEVSLPGERGYDTTATATEALERLQSV